MVLGPRDLPLRALYWTPGVSSWCQQLVQSGEVASGMLSYELQLNQAFADFVSGRPLASGLTRTEPPRNGGIWKLHTPNIRLFGWCVEPQTLVLAACEKASVLKAAGKPRYKDLAVHATVERRRLNFKDWHIGDIRSAFPAIN